MQPRWSDMDANQHVNNVKYIGWLLEVRNDRNHPNSNTCSINHLSEFDDHSFSISGCLFVCMQSVPVDVLEDYNMSRMTLEYRRECRQSNVLESLTSINVKGGDDEGAVKVNTDNGGGEEDVECTHLLRMEGDQAEIVRARSVWHFKQHHRIVVPS